MRRTLLAVLLAAAPLAGGSALAEDASDAASQRTETLDGLVRIVGAQAGIVLYCRKLYTVDDAISDGLSRTARRALEAATGRHQAEAAIAIEGQRVAEEIATVGAERWCADQRDILNTDGVRVFLD
ncbi:MULTISPECIES: hypothetical protein [unclassified Methylobacterium]|jgi:hypothetical protein|uniref:hypothetical protein n=1 Tax=unclassified Methylobacterium TaxID=2615210 RepID=UPI001353D3D0|nr:hypothetical protein [Methylobacterium sp. 2A]MWV21923.1 hypothetical protein [Methylobacterium sp. 2A]